MAEADNVQVTQRIELIYDAAIAAEKLKNGTKYERLTAVVFKILQDSSYVVHDVRLRGNGKETAVRSTWKSPSARNRSAASLRGMQGPRTRDEG